MNLPKSIDQYNSDLKKINPEICLKINSYFDGFKVLYKSLNNKPSFHKKEILSKEQSNIKVQEIISHTDIVFNKSTPINEVKDILSNLDEYTFDMYAYITISKLLNINKEIILQHIKIKKLSSSIWKKLFQLNQPFNSSDNLKLACESYVNNPEITSDEISSEVTQYVFQNNASKRQVDNILLNKQREKSQEKHSKNVLTKKDIDTWKLKKRIAEIENQILIELGEVYYLSLIRQIDLLVEKSLKSLIKEDETDSRFNSFSILLNKFSAIEYIKLFIYENRSQDSNISQKYLTHNNEKYITNDEITTEISELFIKKIELVRVNKKNT